MFEHKKLQNLDGIFTDLSKRENKGVYFQRIAGYNEQIQEFLIKLYETARLAGVVIEGRIPNPDEKNLSYYGEIMGMDFQMSMGFLLTSLKKWLPRMNDLQRNNVAGAIYDQLDFMRRNGKNENMLKNAYIKFMCWLYYKFERILNQLGNEKLPKIVYDGEISNYELALLSILSKAGCDIVLLEYQGDAHYQSVDPKSELSDLYSTANMTSFPKDFSITALRAKIEEQAKMERLYGSAPSIKNCTNAWMSGDVFSDLLKTAPERGSDTNFFYNGLVRITGVEDKITYQNVLYQFQLQLKHLQRKFVIVENTLTPPTMEEISAIRRSNYTTIDQMLFDLLKNIAFSSNMNLQALLKKSFIDVLLEEKQKEEINLNRLTNKAIYLLCWLKRYQSELFSNLSLPNLSCFIYLGGCKNDSESLFLKLLSRLPVDVLILVPDLSQTCVLEDKFLYEKKYQESLVVNVFPKENGMVQMATAAYHAERELDTIMYQDSGMYRERQHDKAVAVTLTTMYEEIYILWDQEVKYRPNFSVTDGLVNLPVIFAKVSGVKDGSQEKYWRQIKSLITEDTLLIKEAPYIRPTDANPMKAHTSEFIKNGKILKEKIKSHPAYQYKFLREEIQDYILEKLQILIDQKVIKGTFVNGTEYTIVATVLNLNKEIIRMIQKMDFTKKNPKLIYINTTESLISLEDSILIAFLNLIGFDIAFFIPTGYQNIESYFNIRMMEEHQAGEYMYDLRVPDFRYVTSITRQTWRDKIFKRGN